LPPKLSCSTKIAKPNHGSSNSLIGSDNVTNVTNIDVQDYTEMMPHHYYTVLHDSSDVQISVSSYEIVNSNINLNGVDVTVQGYSQNILTQYEAGYNSIEQYSEISGNSLMANTENGFLSGFVNNFEVYDHVPEEYCYEELLSNDKGDAIFGQALVFYKDDSMNANEQPLFPNLLMQLEPFENSMAQNLSPELEITTENTVLLDLDTNFPVITENIMTPTKFAGCAYNNPVTRTCSERLLDFGKSVNDTNNHYLQVPKFPALGGSCLPLKSTDHDIYKKEVSNEIKVNYQHVEEQLCPDNSFFKVNTQLDVTIETSVQNNNINLYQHSSNLPVVHFDAGSKVTDKASFSFSANAVKDIFLSMSSTDSASLQNNDDEDLMYCDEMLSDTNDNVEMNHLVFPQADNSFNVIEQLFSEVLIQEHSEQICDQQLKVDVANIIRTEKTEYLQSLSMSNSSEHIDQLVTESWNDILTQSTVDDLNNNNNLTEAALLFICKDHVDTRIETKTHSQDQKLHRTEKRDGLLLDNAVRFDNNIQEYTSGLLCENYNSTKSI
jgi:hypothetical protein